MTPFFEQIFVISTLLIMVVFLFQEKFKPSLVFLGGIMIFILTGVISVEEFLSGFSNKAILTIILLLLLIAGVKNQINFSRFSSSILGKGSTENSFRWKMTILVASLSSVMNNTPIVASLIPFVNRWAKSKKTFPSKFLIPLSYSAILGGMITLIGTSTNLVLNGLLIESGEAPLGFLDFLIPGILVTVFGLLFINTIGTKLIPENHNPLDDFKENSTEYLLETKINSNSQLIGKSILDAGLRNLKDVFLVELIREGNLIRPVGPQDLLNENDILVFTGDIESLVELIKNKPGIELNNFDNHSNEILKHITEAVVPVNSYLEGKIIKESNFREKFDAGILSVHRKGERLESRLGEIQIKAGDLLLLNSGTNFIKRAKRNKDLIVISQTEKAEKKSGKLFTPFILGFITLLILCTLNQISLFSALFIAVGFQVFLGLLKFEEIKNELDLDLILILVCALSLGVALVNSQAGALLASHITQILLPFGTWGLLAGFFICTVILTNFVSNIAAVSIIFPVVLALKPVVGDDISLFYLTIAFGASCAFITPFGYQTNLMVLGPGNYKVQDFARIGLPLTVIYGLVFFGYLLLK
ncbi:MAG: di/tricarboxylate transporter [Sphingobacteriales bacterium]|jgi:di/tricarboxylate transporter